MAEFLTGSICLSDIDKSLIKKADNGKMYLNIAVSERTNKETDEPEADKYGYTHAVIIRKEDKTKIYIGNLKRYTPKVAAPPTAEQINEAPVITQQEADDLPF